MKILSTKDSLKIRKELLVLRKFLDIGQGESLEIVIPPRKTYKEPEEIELEELLKNEETKETKVEETVETKEE